MLSVSLSEIMSNEKVQSEGYGEIGVMWKKRGKE